MARTYDHNGTQQNCHALEMIDTQTWQIVGQTDRQMDRHTDCQTDRA